MTEERIEKYIEDTRRVLREFKRELLVTRMRKRSAERYFKQKAELETAQEENCKLSNVLVQRAIELGKLQTTQLSVMRAIAEIGSAALVARVVEETGLDPRNVVADWPVAMNVQVPEGLPSVLSQ